MSDEERFLAIVTADPTVRTILDPGVLLLRRDRGPDGELRVCARHGYDDLFAMVVRPNRRLAPRHVYEANAARWQQTWPELTVLPWETDPST